MSQTTSTSAISLGHLEVNQPPFKDLTDMAADLLRDSSNAGPFHIEGLVQRMSFEGGGLEIDPITQAIVVAGGQTGLCNLMTMEMEQLIPLSVMVVALQSATVSNRPNNIAASRIAKALDLTANPEEGPVEVTACFMRGNIFLYPSHSYLIRLAVERSKKSFDDGSIEIGQVITPAPTSAHGALAISTAINNTQTLFGNLFQGLSGIKELLPLKVEPTKSI